MALLEQAILYYATAGYDLIRLEAVSSAVAFYERMGFVGIGSNGTLTVMIYYLNA
jgi:ribosomal protein S18 acetylase RimI-like enzyme